MSDISEIRDFPRKTSTALAYLDEPVLITDPKGILVYLNPRGEKNLGLEMNLAIGRHIKELLPEWLAQGLIEGLEKLKKESKGLKIPLVEKEQNYLVELDPIIPRDKLIGAIIILRRERDIEELNRLNESIFRSLLDEIYQPINQLTILFSREIGEDRKELQKLYQDSQALIKNSIAALNDLIDLSPILTSNIRLNKNRFHPSVLIKLAIRSFLPRAEAKNIILFRLDHKDMAEVIADQAKLNRVLIILLEHFMELVPPGEILALSADLNLAPAPVLTYSITATGIKKTEEDFYCLSCEFSPDFAMLSSQDKKKQKALVIASRLILAMKGTTNVVSMDKIGTTLSFSIPVSIAE